MKCETVIELSPDELAQLVASHIKRQNGIEVKSLALHDASDNLVSYQKVVIRGDCLPPITQSPFENRAEQLQGQQAQLMEVLRGVEPFRSEQQEDPVRPGGE